MKHLRVSASVDPDLAPEFFTVLANSSAITQARVLEWNTTLDGREDTVLIAIEGDPVPFRDVATETPGIESIELSEPGGGWTYALLETRPLATPMFDTIHRARTRTGLVVRKPVVYRDGGIFFRVVGDPEPLQAALDRAADVIDVQIDEIGRFDGSLDRPAELLSDRQREALTVALELGYFDLPRGATHEDVAGELGCAPATASEHLQKAEAKVVRAVMDDFGPDV